MYDRYCKTRKTGMQSFVYESSSGGGKGAKGASAPGGTVQGRHLERAKMEF